MYVDEAEVIKPKGQIGRSFRSEEVLPVYPRGEDELPVEVRERLDKGALFRGCRRRLGGGGGGGGGDGDGWNNCTMVKFDDRNDVRLEGYMNCALILFMVFLLSFGSWLFTVIAKRLAVEPIERMLDVVDIVSLSLNSFQRDGNKYGESRKKGRKKKQKIDLDEEKNSKKKKKKKTKERVAYEETESSLDRQGSRKTATDTNHAEGVSEAKSDGDVENGSDNNYHNVRDSVEKKKRWKFTSPTVR